MKSRVRSLFVPLADTCADVTSFPFPFPFAMWELPVGRQKRNALEPKTGMILVANDAPARHPPSAFPEARFAVLAPHLATRARHVHTVNSTLLVDLQEISLP